MKRWKVPEAVQEEILAKKAEYTSVRKMVQKYPDNQRLAQKKLELLNLKNTLIGNHAAANAEKLEGLTAQLVDAAIDSLKQAKESHKRSCASRCLQTEVMASQYAAIEGLPDSDTESAPLAKAQRTGAVCDTALGHA